MTRVGTFPRQLRSEEPEFQLITGAFGDTATRPPPSPESLHRARVKFLNLLGGPPGAIHEKHPHSCWHAGVFRALQKSQQIKT